MQVRTEDKVLTKDIYIFRNGKLENKEVESIVAITFTKSNSRDERED